MTITQYFARCLKCNTNQLLRRMSTGPKETDWCWWCSKCKDRIDPSAVKDITFFKEVEKSNQK